MDNNELTLQTSQEELEERLMKETSVAELDNIIQLFNLNIKKKDIVRSNKLSDLQDKISDQIGERVEKHADQFSNKDLLDYFKVLQDIIDRSDNSLENVKTPVIQLNQQNISVDMNNNGLNKDSRDRIIDAVQAVLKRYNIESNPIQDVEVISEQPLTEQDQEELN